MHTAGSPMGRQRWADIYIKGVSVRFGFDDIGIWKIQTISQEQSNKERPMGCLYTGSLLAHGGNKSVAHFVFSSGHCKIYNIIVGLSTLLVSTNRAIQSLYIVERVTDGSTFLFCILSYAFTELMNCPAPMEPRRSKYDLCHGNMKRTNLNQLSLAIELYFCNKY